MLFRSRPLRAYGPRCMHCARPLRNPLGRLRFCRRCGRSQMGYA